ncbi:MAG: glycosyltransferase [Thiopseudomonas sp.]|nr:glycosyltransferase [Thiopseudomonas sp.]
MPAYKTQYIDQALDSLIGQSYPNLELIVCDDSTTEAVRERVEAKAAHAPFPVHYSKNEKRLWGFGGVEKGVKLAQGEYIKILHDDDLIKPDAIQNLLRALLNNPGATLATSRRERIDEQGGLLADDIYTVNPFGADVRVKGDELVSFLADNTINFIGEPSCTLCRKADLEKFTERPTYLNGKGIAWVGDLAFYAKLLRMGDLVYLAEPQAQFRVSQQQFSQIGRDKVGIGEQGHANFRQAIRDLGWYRSEGDNNLVQVAHLDSSGAAMRFKPVDLLNALFKAEYQSRFTEVSIEDWLAKRTLNARQARYFNGKTVCLSVQVLVLDADNNALAVKRTLKSLDSMANLPLALRPHVITAAPAVPALNQALHASHADWCLVVEAGTELVYSGWVMALMDLPDADCRAVCFDQVYRPQQGRLGAALRPSFNLDYLLSFPAGMAKNWLFNRQALLAEGGFNEQLPQAFELDAILRMVNSGGMAGLAHIAEPLVIVPSPQLVNIEDERKAIEAHLQARGYAQAQLHAPNPGRYQVRYNHPAQPIVSLLIKAGSNLGNLQRCVEGLLGNTAYQNFEILFIEPPQSSGEVKEWLAALEQMQEAKLRVLRPAAADSAGQLAAAAEQAIGDYVLLLSPDTAMVSQYWLDELLNHGQRGEVGVVGAKLLSAEGTIAHAGLLLGLQGPVGAPFMGEALDAAGYMQRLQVDQNLSAVGSDCMLILKQLFVELGGFDAALADDYQSTDFCLRAAQAGFLTVWTPHAQLMLDRDRQPRPDAQQQDAMYAKWLPQLARDPAYNPNLSLAMLGGYRLADSQISWRPLDSVRPQPLALVHPADVFGCGHYRVMQPFLAMQDAGLLDGAISTGLMQVADLERYNPDCIVLQRQIGEERLEAMQRMQRFSRAFKVYELDDYLPNLPLKSASRERMPKDILRSLRRGLAFVDRFVVSTHALAEAFSGLHGEIVVRENRLPLRWWSGLQTQRRQGSKPRVGWAGGSSHTGDLELITDVVRDLADEVEWVFFGMCPEALKPYVHEFHTGVPIDDYPAKLAALNLDLGLAPLEHNLFNECKSNLRQLEYGVCGIPIICTDIRPYQEGQQAGLPVTLVKNRYKDWVDAIRMHINDLDATAKMADELQAKVRSDWMLEGEHLKHWRDAWVTR